MRQLLRGEPREQCDGLARRGGSGGIRGVFEPRERPRHGDAGEPERERDIPGVSGQSAVGGQERLPGDVFGVGGAPKHPKNDAPDAGEMEVEQLIERVAVALPRSVD